MPNSQSRRLPTKCLPRASSDRIRETLASANGVAVVGTNFLAAKRNLWRRCALGLLFAQFGFVNWARGQGVSRTFDDLFSEAAAAREQNEIPQAIELYKQAVQVNSKSAEAWWFLGSLQYREGTYPSAIEALSRYLELTPDAAPALALRGLSEFETGEYRQSLTDIQKGISLGAANDPRKQQVLRYHEALLLTRSGRFEDALKSYSFFADNRIASPELFAAIGLAGLRMPRLPAELSADQQTLVSAAGGAAYQFMSGDLEGAKQAFQTLFQQFPTAPYLHYFYGYLLFPTNGDKSLNEFKSELQVAPTNLDAQIMTAWVLLIADRAAEALPYAESAAIQKPDSVSAQLVLGRSLTDTGDVSRGIEHLERGLKQEPDDLETHIALAKAYSLAGRKEEARRERMLCLQLTQGSGLQLASR